jgi:hypothetical protein
VRPGQALEIPRRDGSDLRPDAAGIGDRQAGAEQAARQPTSNMRSMACPPKRRRISKRVLQQQPLRVSSAFRHRIGGFLAAFSSSKIKFRHNELVIH